MNNTAKLFVAKSGSTVSGQTFVTHTAVPDGTIAIFDATAVDSAGVSHHSDILQLPNNLPKEFVILQGVANEKVHQTPRLHRKRLCTVIKTTPRNRVGEILEIKDIPANCCGVYTIRWHEWTEYTKLNEAIKRPLQWEQCDCICEPLPNNTLLETLTELMNFYNGEEVFPFTVTLNSTNDGLLLTAKDTSKQYDVSSDECLKCATITIVQESVAERNTGKQIALLEKRNRTWYGKSTMPTQQFDVYAMEDGEPQETAYQKLFTDETLDYVTYDLVYKSSHDAEVFPMAENTVITLAYPVGTDTSALDVLFANWIN